MQMATVTALNKAHRKSELRFKAHQCALLSIAHHQAGVMPNLLELIISIMTLNAQVDKKRAWAEDRKRQRMSELIHLCEGNKVTIEEKV